MPSRACVLPRIDAGSAGWGAASRAPRKRRPPNPSRSNQRRHDAGDRHRCRCRSELELPPLHVYLPAVVHDDRRDEPWRERCRRRESSDEDSSSDNDTVMPPISMRSQRMRSLAAISRLQHLAATTIQVHRSPPCTIRRSSFNALLQSQFRLYRRRCASWHRRNQRLARQAQAFLDVFLRSELQASVVPACLLEVLRETRAEVTCRQLGPSDLPYHRAYPSSPRVV